ncbi:MAG: sensor histidine kinase, partial [Chloroflexota bacterium]
DNIGRHSGAGTVAVDLRRENDTVLLRVSDDGRGLPTGSAEESSNLAVAAIRERVRSIGGHLQIHPGAKGGTVIEARVPLGARRQRKPE